MPCTNPTTAWKDAGGIRWTRQGSTGIPVKIPCRQCMHCRLKASQDWQSRIIHESRLHRDAIFLTLTYGNDHLPPHGSLSIRDWQLFMKRLRKETKRKLRFVMCGEYGPTTLRPHYHAILFGWWPEDSKVQKGGKHPVWTSKTIDKCWGKGHHSFGTVTGQSAGYVAGYTIKKAIGEKARAARVERVLPETGEVVQVEAEFFNMSRRPGIGHGYFERYGQELDQHDFVVVNGVRRSVPKYYDKKLPEKVLQEKQYQRRIRARPYKKDNTPERLAVREVVLKARLNLKRKGKI